jgi:hypothetical protein
VKIIAEIVISLKMLEKVKTFHGRLKLNNVHIDITETGVKTILNDYGIYNDVYRGHKKRLKDLVLAVEEEIESRVLISYFSPRRRKRKNSQDEFCRRPQSGYLLPWNNHTQNARKNESRRGR